ncbi:MAG: tetratricopeptide repeat protein [Treponema sp.]|nr:tetratricopeptide repeat protein [Treponema sp.]
MLYACKTEPPVQPAPIRTPPPASGSSGPVIRGIADEIRYQVETGSPRSLAQAVSLIQGRGLGTVEFGRLMNAAAAALLRSVYPDLPVRYLPPDAPVTSAYTRILRNVDRGIYTPPPADSRDFLEYILPFLAYYPEPQGNTRLRDTLPDLEKAAALNPDSVLPSLFRGFVYEKEGSAGEAETAYREVLENAADCYPAELGLIRIMNGRGEGEQAASRLVELLVRYPDNMGIKKELARNYAAAGNWSGAEAAIAEILQRNPRDGEFLLLKAYTAMEQGRYQEAQAPLDTYASIDSGNRQYLFLRARLQAESYRNRDSALNYLRSIIRSRPDDTEALVYMAGLLMESVRPEDAAEGRTILANLLGKPNPNPEVLSLAVKDTIRREAWREARELLERLLARRRNNEDLLDAYRVERGLGNSAAALGYARELFNREGAGEEATAAYLTALIDTGRQSEALRIIEQRLQAVSGGAQKSRYYYLRSRLRNNDDAAMNDLRSSLFEDPRNLDALVAMFEIYHRRRDERRAVYYLKQALALDPNNPQLRRYETEYRAALGSSY